MRAITTVAIAVGVLLASAQPRFSTEYDIKAAIVFNLSQFVDWPESAFAGPDSPLVIGVLGQNPFGKGLDRAAEGEIVQKRKITVKYADTLAELGAVHILFISRSESRRLAEILRLLQGTRALTVSDIDRFAQNGGMVNLVTAADRVRMLVNVEQVEAAGLRASSKLLRISELVKE
jgi:hypothetical protein